MPAAITDLRITASTETSVSLAWTAPTIVSVGGDAIYTLRYSTTPLSAGSFGLATDVTPPAIGTAGTTETLTVSGLVPGYAYEFAIIAGDDDGTSDISNIPSVHLLDPIYRYLTSNEGKLAQIWNARHKFIETVTLGVSTPYTMTPSPGKRIIINSIIAQVSHATTTIATLITATSPGVELAHVSATPAGGAQSRYWQGWPWFVANRDQPITFSGGQTGSGKWATITLGYFEA
jgi:hypothetical protein